MDEIKRVEDLLDEEEAKPCPGAEIFEAGDLVADASGRQYLVTWPNATPAGTPLDRMPALELTPDLRGVLGDAQLMVADGITLVRTHHLDFETTRKLHWGYYAGLIKREQ